MAIGSYNSNPALNTAISGIDISENCAASGFNNALRQIMADLAVFNASMTFPMSIANGGTGQATATAGFNALAGAGGIINGNLSIGGETAVFGKITRDGAGSFPYFASTSMTNPRIFVQASGSDPTSVAGDIVFEY